MTSTRAKTAAVISGAALWFTIVAGAQTGGQTFKIRLTTVPIDFVEAANVTGTGSATAVLTGNALKITGTFEKLHGPATTAELHRGRILGVRGPSIGTLTVTKETSGTFEGTVTLTSAQVDAAKEGMIYVQINSEPAPSGNLWGWLLKPERTQ